MYRNVFALPDTFDNAPDQTDSVSKGIDPNHIISRDENNNLISAYKDDMWDFSPYAKRNNRFYFDRHIKGEPSELDQILKAEAKAIMFLLIHDPFSNHRNCKAGTFHSILSGLRKIIDLCKRLNITIEESVNNKEFQDALKHSVLTATNYKNKAARPVRQLLISIKAIYDRSDDAKELIPSLIICEEYRLDILAMLSRNVREGDGSSYPTPLIPSRIFANILDGLHNTIERIYLKADRIVDFFRDTCSKEGVYYFVDDYGTYSQTKRRLSRLYPSYSLLGWDELDKSKTLTSRETFDKYDLYELFEDFTENLSDYQRLKGVTSKWLIAIGMLIQCYTGMRRHEVEVMDLDAYEEAVIDGFGTISVINSYTSKIRQDNYSRRSPWATAPHVKMYCDVARKLVEARWYMHRTDPFPSDLRSIPMFYSYTSLEPGQYYDYKLLDLDYADERFSLSNLIDESLYDVTIRESDIQELMTYDAFQDWDSRKEFKVGTEWPLSTHQIRKSVAVYAARSQMVSLPSLGAQYKHLSLNMTSLYTNNSLFARNFVDASEDKDAYGIFGLFLEAKQFYGALTFHNEVIKSEYRLSGGKGAHIQLAKDRNVMPVWLTDIKETENKIKRGELSYTSTVVGGCMRVGVCEQYEVAEIVPCVFDCAYSITGGDGGAKLKAYRDELEFGLDEMDEGTPAYSETVREINRIDMKLLEEKEW